MGKQYDKVIKRRRRSAYLERRKTKAKEAAVAASKPRVRKPMAKKPAAPKAEAPAKREMVPASKDEPVAAPVAADTPPIEE